MPPPWPCPLRVQLLALSVSLLALSICASGLLSRSGSAAPSTTPSICFVDRQAAKGRLHQTIHVGTALQQVDGDGEEQQRPPAVTVDAPIAVEIMLPSMDNDKDKCFGRAVLQVESTTSAEKYFVASRSTGQVERVFASDHKPEPGAPPRSAIADDLLLRALAALQAGGKGGKHDENTPDGVRQVEVHADKPSDVEGDDEGMSVRTRTFQKTARQPAEIEGSVVFEKATGRIVRAHLTGHASIALPSGDAAVVDAELTVQFSAGDDSAHSATLFARTAFDLPLPVSEVRRRFGESESLAQYGAQVKLAILSHAPRRASALPLRAPPAPPPPSGGYASAADELWAAAADLQAHEPGADGAAALAQAVNAAADDWIEDPHALRSAAMRLSRADNAMIGTYARAGQAALLASLTAARDEMADNAILTHLLESSEPTEVSGEARTRAEIARASSAAAIAAHPTPSARMLQSLLEFHRQRLMEGGICEDCPPNDMSMLLAYTAALCRAAAHAAASPNSPAAEALIVARDDGVRQLSRWVITASRGAVKAMDKGAPVATYVPLTTSLLFAFASVASHPAMDDSVTRAAASDVRRAADEAESLLRSSGDVAELAAAASAVLEATGADRGSHRRAAKAKLASASAAANGNGPVSASHRTGFAAASAVADRAGSLRATAASLAGGRCTRGSLAHQLIAGWTMEATVEEATPPVEAISLSLDAAGTGTALLRVWGSAVETGNLPAACDVPKSASPGHVAVAPGPRQLAPLVIGASLPAAMSTAHYALHRSNTTWHGFGCDDMSEASLSASPWLATASLWDVDVMAGDGAYLATLRARSSRSARVSVNSRASVAQAGMCATHAEAEAAAPGASEMHVSATTAVLKRTCSSPTTCEWQLESGTAEKSEFAKTISAEVSTKAQRAEQRSATTSDEL